MAKQPNSGASQHHLLNHGTNGKGDRDRTLDRARYAANFSEIVLPGGPRGFVNIGGGRIRKTYAQN